MRGKSYLIVHVVSESQHAKMYVSGSGTLYNQNLFIAIHCANTPGRMRMNVTNKIK